MSHKKKEIEKTLLLVMKLIRSEGFTADDLISPKTKKSSTPETRTRFNRINEMISEIVCLVESIQKTSQQFCAI